MLTLAVLVGIAIALTLVAFKSGLILFRMVAALAWLVLGILLLTSPATIGVGAFPTTVRTVMGFIFLMMIIAVLLLQINTEIRREMVTKGRAGYPGAQTSSWTEWGPAPNKKKMTKADASRLRQEEYKDRLGEIRKRATKRRRGY